MVASSSTTCSTIDSNVYGQTTSIYRTQPSITISSTTETSTCEEETSRVFVLKTTRFVRVFTDKQEEEYKHPNIHEFIKQLPSFALKNLDLQTISKTYKRQKTLKANMLKVLPLSDNNNKYRFINTKEILQKNTIKFATPATPATPANQARIKEDKELELFYQFYRHWSQME